MSTRLVLTRGFLRVYYFNIKPDLSRSGFAFKVMGVPMVPKDLLNENDMGVRCFGTVIELTYSNDILDLVDQVFPF